MRESHIEFQVNRASFDQKSKLGIFLVVKSKSSVCGTPNGFKTRTKAYGWSRLLLKKLHVEFQVIPTSFDLVSMLDKKLAILHSKSSAFQKMGNFVIRFARLLVRFS